MNHRAFTLIEVLTVIVITSTLATIGIFSINKVVLSSKESWLTSSAVNIRTDIVNYMIKNRSNEPQFNVQLIPSVVEYEGINVEKNDPWGNPYEIIYADVTKDNGQLYINIFFQVTNQGCYSLPEGETKVLKIGETCNYNPE